MARKFFAGILIALSVTLLVASIAAIAALWFYNEPLTREVTTRLQEIDGELALAESTLASSELEVERALRIVDSAQTALEQLSDKTQGAENLFENIQSSLDDRLIPELKQTRTRIESARRSLENLQSVLEGISRLIPGVEVVLPRQVIVDLISSARTLDGEIANVEVLAGRASVYVRDSSYLLGGDLTGTRKSLKTFLSSIQEYEKKVAGWRAEAQRLTDNAPRWIDQASIGLTIFLVWFALSQFGLLLHGLHLQRGDDPLVVLRRQPREEVLLKEEDIDLELGA